MSDSEYSSSSEEEVVYVESKKPKARSNARFKSLVDKEVEKTKTTHKKATELRKKKKEADTAQVIPPTPTPTPIEQPKQNNEIDSLKSMILSLNEKLERVNTQKSVEPEVKPKKRVSKPKRETQASPAPPQPKKPIQPKGSGESVVPPPPKQMNRDELIRSLFF